MPCQRLPDRITSTTHASAPWFHGITFTDYRFGNHGIFDRVLAIFPARLPLTLAWRSRQYVSETLLSLAVYFSQAVKRRRPQGRNAGLTL